MLGPVKIGISVSEDIAEMLESLEKAWSTEKWPIRGAGDRRVHRRSGQLGQLRTLPMVGETVEGRPPIDPCTWQETQRGAFYRPSPKPIRSAPPNFSSLWASL
jgi:hypothetical protein